MRDRSDDRTTVLFIGGAGRSGSTLLDRMLGQIPGFLSTGELREVWNRGVIENLDCGCGRPFRDCPFWTAVGDEAFGGWSRVDAEEMRALGARIDRPGLVPLILAPAAAPGYRGSLDRYTETLAHLYRAIRGVGSARAAVDSSKSPSTAFLLRRIPAIDLRVVHLIRDVRGVAYSWTKLVRRPDARERELYMHQYHPVRMAARWLYRCALMDLLGTLQPQIAVHYEDMVRDAGGTLLRIASGLGLSATPESLRFVSNGTVTLRPNHTVMGNPIRLHVGPLPLRLDEEWRTAMPSLHRRLVTAVGWPMLMRYGYRV